MGKVNPTTVDLIDDESLREYIKVCKSEDFLGIVDKCLKVADSKTLMSISLLFVYRIGDILLARPQLRVRDLVSYVNAGPEQEAFFKFDEERVKYGISPDFNCLFDIELSAYAIRLIVSYVFGKDTLLECLELQRKFGDVKSKEDAKGRRYWVTIRSEEVRDAFDRVVRVAGGNSQRVLNTALVYYLTTVHDFRFKERV